MAQLYHCYQSPSSAHPKTFKTTNTIRDLPSALACLRKTALNVSDVSLKLQLADLSKFLSSLESPWSAKASYVQREGKNASKQNQISKHNQAVESKRGQFFYREQASQSALVDKTELIPQMLENQPSCKRVLAELVENTRIKTKIEQKPFRNSKMKEDLYERHTQSQVVEGGQFMWRNTVTRNVLQDEDESKTVYLEGDNLSKRCSELQLLKDNKKMKECLKNISEWVATKDGLGNAEQCIQQIKRQLLPFECLTVEDSQNRSRSVPIRIGQRSSDTGSLFALGQSELTLKVETIEESLREKSREIEEWKLKFEKSNQINEQLEQEVASKRQEVSKFQMLLFIKDEQISTLKIMLKEFQRSQREGQEHASKSKDCQKYYQSIQSNFSSTVN